MSGWHESLGMGLSWFDNDHPPSHLAILMGHSFELETDYREYIVRS